jgi:hypothetical protein
VHEHEFYVREKLAEIPQRRSCFAPAATQRRLPIARIVGRTLRLAGEWLDPAPEGRQAERRSA